MTIHRWLNARLLQKNADGTINLGHVYKLVVSEKRGGGRPLKGLKAIKEKKQQKDSKKLPSDTNRGLAGSTPDHSQGLAKPFAEQYVRFGGKL